MSDDEETDRADDFARYDANLDYHAFVFALAGREHGWTKNELLAALDGQWEATERMAGAFGANGGNDANGSE